jgi:hypothetical protein
MSAAKGRRRAIVTTVSDISYTRKAIVFQEVPCGRSLLNISTNAGIKETLSVDRGGKRVNPTADGCAEASKGNNTNDRN